jgi:hypothetical protein
LRSPWHRWFAIAATLLAIGFGPGIHCLSPAAALQAGGSFLMQLLANLVLISVTGPLVLFATLWLSAGTLLARFETELSRHQADEVSKQFDRLAYVMRRDRTSEQQMRDAARRIESLRTKVDDLMQQASPTALSPIEMADVRQLHAMCKQAHEDWHRDVEQALAVKHLLLTRTATPGTSLAATTMGPKITDANAQAIVSDLDEQRDREKKDKADSNARKAKLAPEKKLKEQREADLLARATSPEVKSLLAPFIEPRTMQPSLSGTFSIRWVHTDEKKPMSLKKLNEIGALEDSTPGLQKLALIGGNRKLPQPKWSVASQPNHWSSEDEERLRQAQQTLREYGAILTDVGLLSK